MSDLGAGAPDVPTLDRWVTDAQATTVLGAPAERVELLTHNPLNAVTGGIWRVTSAERTAVCKVLTDGRDHDGPAWWAASGDPTHWNWWPREALVYANDVPGLFRPDGIDAPAPLLIDERSAGTTVLWLEWVEGTPGPELGVEGLAAFASALGRAQGRLAEGGPDHASWRGTPWLSRGFLAGYADSKPVDETLLADDRAWAAPRVARHLGSLRDDLRRLHRDRASLYGLAAACPRTLCHLDVWPANLLRRAGDGDGDGAFVLVDWAFCGDGALGEDVANLIPDAFFDLLYPLDLVDEVAGRVESAYLAGLRDGGWEGDERWVALGTRSAAAKYHWLIERLLRDPDASDAVVYGGRPVAPDDLYAARAAGLRLLCRWADEARNLAHDLDL